MTQTATAQTVRFVLGVGSEIALLPMFLTTWGVDGYRDWIVVLAAIEILALLDLGMHNYFGNELTLARASRDDRRVRRAAGLATSFYLATTLSVCLVTAIAVFGGLVPVLASMAGLTTALIWSAGPWLAATVAVKLVLGAVVQNYRAHGDAARGIWVSVIDVVATFVVTSVVLFSGAGALGSAAATLAAALLATTGGLFVAILVDQASRYRARLVRPLLPTRAERRDLLTKGVQLNLLSVAVTASTRGMVLATAFGASAEIVVLVFTTARTIVGSARQLSLQMVTFFAVEQSRVLVRGKRTAFRVLTRMILAIVPVTTGLAMGYALVAASDWLVIWTVGAIHHEAPVFTTLILAGLVSTPTLAAAQAFMYANQPRTLAIALCGAAATAIVVAGLLVPTMGAIGAALGVLIGELVWSGGYLLPAVLRHAGLPLARTMAVTALRGAGALVLGASVTMLAWLPVGGAELSSFLISSCLAATAIAGIAALLLARSRHRRIVWGWVHAR